MNLLLTWAVSALSLFNTITLLWLGLTVLLNAERRSWMTAITGSSIIAGGLLYADHSTVVGHSSVLWRDDLQWWWRIGAIPVLGAPYVWYLVTAVYTGVLRFPRQRLLLALATIGAAIGVGLRLAGHFTATLLALNPMFSIVCIGLSLQALREPQPSTRLMGDLARRRARPWLTASALVLLLINLSFIGVIRWFVPWGTSPVSNHAIMVFDLAIASLVAITVVLTGQAIVRYEIFTGKVLPRGGLWLHWRRVLILASGYGGLLAAVVSSPLQIDPIYHVLLATLLITLFYALLSWRSYGEYERSMKRLRPWISSQRMYEQLLQSASPALTGGVAPLRTLCEDVLDAEQIYLLPLGALTPLIGAGFAYPPAPCLPTVTDLAHRFASPEVMCVPLDPLSHGGTIWAVPLWSERGLVGMLLLGPKRDGGLYTQEAIEIARMTGERVIDMAASAEMAQRLMRLQRERLTETQLLDRRTRRVLHDDVLPQLHTIMLQLSATATKDDTVGEAVTQIGTLHGEIAHLLHALPPTAAREVTQLGLLGALRQVIDREMGDAFDDVSWQIEAGGEVALSRLPPLTAEVVFYASREAVRNAAQHGRGSDPTRRLRLCICVRHHAGWELVIRDDGAGWGAATASTGRGQGFALHSTMMAVVGGTLSAESVVEQYTEVTLGLP